MSELPGRLVLLGRPVAHSLSPRMQNAALHAAGIALKYEAVDCSSADLAALVDALRAVRGAGNVTIPHKLAMRSLCDRLTPLAEQCGAVNTFWTSNGVLVGDNTDVAGFDTLAHAVLGDVFPPQVVAIIGAGGGAAAVCTAVARWRSAATRIWSRTPARALALGDRFPGVRISSRLEDALEGATLVVNATPVGMDGVQMPIDPARLPNDAAVTDLVYREGETPFVREARRRGHAASDGLPMLVEQGAAAFQQWLGVAPDRGVMWSATGRERPKRK